MILTKEEKVKNILCFLAILFGEDDLWENVILKFHPDYLIEKFERYVLSDKKQFDWGLHPSLRRQTVNKYLDKYKISI